VPIVVGIVDGFKQALIDLDVHLAGQDAQIVYIIHD
jgi:hypothetical protein